MMENIFWGLWCILSILVFDLMVIRLGNNLFNTDIRRRIYIVPHSTPARGSRPQACHTNPCTFSFVHPTQCVHIVIGLGLLHVFLGFIPPTMSTAYIARSFTIQN